MTSQQDSYCLERYGIVWGGTNAPICSPMLDGYWTPWHKAHEEILRLRKALAEIEKFGHTSGHGRGFTCANMAQNALNC